MIHLKSGNRKAKSGKSVAGNALRVTRNPVLIAAMLAAMSGAAQAAVLFTEDFNFSGLLSANGWTAISAAGTSAITTQSVTGLTYSGHPGSGVGNAAGFVTTGEDDHKSFTAQSSGTVYVSALINLSAAQSGGDYFFALNNGTTSFIARLYARSSGSGYVLGIGKNTSTALYDTVVRNFNTTYLVVLKYSFLSSTADDTVSLFVEPALGGSEGSATLTTGSTIADTASLGFVMIRQGSSTAAPTGRIDAIRVATTWAEVTASSAPTFSASTSSLSGFSTTEGTASTAQTFTLTGANLTSNLTVAAPTGFEVSTDGATYGTSRTVAPTTGSVNATIFVRLSAAAVAGTPSGNVTVTSANSEVTARNVAVSGTVTAANLPAISLAPTSASGLTNYLGYPSASTNYTVTGTNLGSTNLVVTASTNAIEVSTNATTGFTNTLTFAPTAGVVSNTVFVRLSTNAPAGAVSATVANVSSTASQNFTVSGTVTTPPLTITMASSIFEGDNSQTGTISIPADLVLASDLTVTLTSSSGTDLQVDGGAGFGSSATITISQGTTSATFFLNAPADNTIDADASVTLTATANGFANGTRATTVRNADVVRFSLAATNTPYTQNFDSLGTGNIANAIPTTVGSQANLGSVVGTALNGWFATKLSGTSAGGSTTAITADTGSSSSGLIYSYGPSGNTDRALGALASGSNIMGFGALFQNDTGATINSVTISFTAEFWRTAGSNKNKFTFGYGKLGGGVTGVNFLTVSSAAPWKAADVDGPAVVSPQVALDGNLAANQKAVSTSLNITLAPGEAMFIRWQDADETGSDGGAGIDNFTISASASPAVLTPPTVADVSLDQNSLTQTEATVSSEVTGDGGVGVDTMGFVYSVASVNADPVLGGASVSNVSNNTPAVGFYTNTLTNLTAGTSYAVKAYAINSQGTNYSGVATVATPAANPTFTGVYTQNFSGVTNFAGIPAGWRALSSSNQNNFAGSWTNTNASVGGFYSRSSSPGILGYLHTGSTGVLTNKLTLVNGTGGVLTNLYISYTGEVALTNNTRLPAFAVQVNGVTVPELAYNTAGGTNAAISTQLTGLNIATNATIMITWSCDRGAGTGSSRLIGLTDVRVATTPPNSIPTDIALSAISIAENNSVGDNVGTLSSTDADTSDTFTYTLVAGTGDTDNASFTIVGSTLKAGVAFDFETKSSYSIRVRTTDSSGATFDKPFTITVTDVVEQTAKEAYLASFGLSGADLLGTADPDGDGMNNDAEFAFGTSPVSGASRAATLSSGTGTIKLTYLQRDSGVTYTVKSLPDLATAFDSGTTVTPSASSDQTSKPTGYTRYEASVSTGGNRAFLRVKAVAP